MAPATRREILGIEVDYSLPARRVLILLNKLAERYGKPTRIRTDNGPEFISQHLQDWCREQQVILQWIEPGKPTARRPPRMRILSVSMWDRPCGTFRREVLNANMFSSLAQVCRTVNAWLVVYNTERPHQALKFMTPVEYRQAA
jgi:putative transposase